MMSNRLVGFRAKLEDMKKLIKCILIKLFGDKAYLIFRRIVYWKTKQVIVIKAKIYNKKKESILIEKSRKERLCILFFVSDLVMWRYDGVIKQLIVSPKFNPVIVPFVRPDKNNADRNQDEIIDYCRVNNYPIRIGYDFSSRRYLDISDINPDIVVYTQPYDLGYKKWCIDNYIHNCLFIYTPYGISTSKNKELKDTLLTNIAWKIFVSCQLEKQVYEDSLSVAKGNVVVTGAEIYDRLQTADSMKSPWRNNRKKRLIWAPHHSLDGKKGFSNSNFERICDEMLRIATTYKNSVEIAFKPHPLLKERLIEKWGVDKTERYYRQWESLPNTILCNGGYIELFAFSDAMIHDGASFSYEYLFTNNPVLFLCKDERLQPPDGIGNVLGTTCFNLHYKGFSVDNIEEFINNVVLGGDDSMEVQRELFIKSHLLPPNKKNVSENMLDELSTIFKNH